MKKLFGLCVAVAMVVGAGSMLMAEEAVIDATQTPAAVVEVVVPAASDTVQGVIEAVETTGVIEIVKADSAKDEKYDTILLKAGEITYKLIPNKDKEAFKKLETMAGKTLKVMGLIMPANPPKYPLAAIKVDSFTE